LKRILGRLIIPTFEQGFWLLRPTCVGKKEFFDRREKFGPFYTGILVRGYYDVVWKETVTIVVVCTARRGKVWACIRQTRWLKLEGFLFLRCGNAREANEAGQ
jgi:hypothetical protein